MNAKMFVLQLYMNAIDEENRVLRLRLAEALVQLKRLTEPSSIDTCPSHNLPKCAEVSK